MIITGLDLHSVDKAAKEGSWWVPMKAMLPTDICDVNNATEPLSAVELPVRIRAR